MTATAYNLKIPLAIVSNYNLSPLSIIIFGEIYDIYAKKGTCYITNKTLAKRHHSNNTSIKKAILSLKQAKLIKRLPTDKKEVRKLKVLPVSETSKASTGFILIPDYLLQDLSLRRIDELIFGYLVSESKKQEKINQDKKLKNAIPTVITTKTDIAIIFKCSPITVKRSIDRLKQAQYLTYDSIKGKHLEIRAFYSYATFPQKISLPDRFFIDSPLVTNCNLYQNRASTYIKIGPRPISKSGLDLYQKWATNRVLNRVFNKEEKSSSNKDHPRTSTYPQDKNETMDDIPFYDLPSVEDMPPEIDYGTTKDIEDLNMISQQIASSIQPTTRTSRTAKSGSEGAKDKQISFETKKDQDKNKSEKSISCTKRPASKIKAKHYQPYNGFNLDYQCNALQSMLRSITNKHYVITKQNYSQLEQRLKGGYSLEDFEFAITSLHNKHEPISIKKLITHIGDYISKTNLN